jgi:hypothetical protein
MTNYRSKDRKVYKRPLRISNNKPHTIDNHETANLLAWLQCYPFMAKKPRAWFNRQRFSQPELREVYQAGLTHVALELGYEHRQPLQVLSEPIIVSIAPNKGQFAPIEQINKAA